MVDLYQQKIDSLEEQVKWPSEWNVLVLNAGNSDLKGYINGEYFVVPTSYTSTRGYKPREMSEQRPAIDGCFAVYDRNDKNRQYKFGVGQEGGKMPANSDKGAFYKTFVQGCCAAAKDTSLPYRVIISHWDEYRDNEIEAQLLGTHVVCVNGKDIQFEIKEVIFVPEGGGSDLIYRQVGAGRLAIVDIGYDTIGVRVTGDNGQLNHDYLPGYGVRRVVKDIMQSPDFTDRVSSFNARKVICAIKDNGMYRDYGQMSADGEVVENPIIDINDVIAPAVQEWVQDAFGEIDSVFGDNLSQASAYWIVGGGANLLRKYVPGTVFVPAEPEKTDTLGMLLKV